MMPDDNMLADEDSISTPAHTQVPSVSAPHSSDERTLAALAHGSALLNWVTGFGGLIAAALIWLTQKEKSTWVAAHGFQSLIFQGAQVGIVVVVVGGVWIVGFACSFLTLGFGAFIAVPVMILVFFLGIALMIGGLVYSLYGAYQIYQGREFRYIWTGEWAERHFPDVSQTPE